MWRKKLSLNVEGPAAGATVAVGMTVRLISGYSEGISGKAKTNENSCRYNHDCMYVCTM